MKNRVLGLALGASMLFGFQQLAVAAPLTAPASPAEIVLGQMSAAEPVYYARRTTVVRGGHGHGCAGGRRCVGGYTTTGSAVPGQPAAKSSLMRLSLC
jgi:hypothetical protein